MLASEVPVKLELDIQINTTLNIEFRIFKNHFLTLYQPVLTD